MALSIAAKSLNFNSLANFSEPGERETLLRLLLNRKVHDSYLRKIKASSINVFFFYFLSNRLLVGQIKENELHGLPVKGRGELAGNLNAKLA